MRENESPLDDFPLHEAAGGRMFRAPDAAASRLPAPQSAASLAARWPAAAADFAAILLLVAVAILAARWATGSSPRLPGMAWALGFLVYLSLFATVPPLVLFGKTIGMAIAELAARSGTGGAGLPAPVALRRWVGTLTTALGAGLPLLWTARNPEAPTPADRLSGCPLTLE